jgi:D-glycero-alpha-D-manno-heptose 1-phosphate guanylyltransferase
MEAIVLAGGLGMRLASRLNGLPKPMAPVAGRPFVEFLLSQLRRAGCARVLLSVGNLHQVIQDHFGSSYRGMRLDYVIENAPLGTGGALRAALGQATEEAVLALNGDTFLDVNYAAMLEFHGAEDADLTMAISHQPDIARYGGVLVEGKRIAGFHEKGRPGPGWFNAGAYVLNRELHWPLTLPAKFSFELDYLTPEIGRIVTVAYKVDGVFLDIGVPEDLDRAQIELAGIVI